jgi:hypothetical protein
MIVPNIRWTTTWSFTGTLKLSQKNFNTTNNTVAGKGFVVKLH